MSGRSPCQDISIVLGEANMHRGLRALLSLEDFAVVIWSAVDHRDGMDL